MVAGALVPVRDGCRCECRMLWAPVDGGGGLRAVCRSRRTDFLTSDPGGWCVSAVGPGLEESGAVLAAVKDEPRWRAVACGDP